MSCQRCGRCCTEVVFYATKDVRRYLELHGLRCEDTADERLRIHVPALCELMAFEDGLAVCKDYENRPEQCRKYDCGGAA